MSSGNQDMNQAEKAEFGRGHIRKKCMETAALHIREPVCFQDGGPGQPGAGGALLGKACSWEAGTRTGLLSPPSGSLGQVAPSKVPGVFRK